MDAFLEAIIVWPRTLGRAIATCQDLFPVPDFGKVSDATKEEALDAELERQPDTKGVLFAILWMLLLIYIAWPLASIATGIWTILMVRFTRWTVMKECELDPVCFRSHFLRIWNSQPFEYSVEFVRPISEFLAKFATWPRILGLAIRNCQGSSVPSPF